MKSVDNQSTNNVTIVGKLVNFNKREGMTKAGKPYVGGRATIRVHQQYLGNDEISDIPVSFFATKFTSKGTNNSAYEAIQNLSNLKTIEANGLDEADTVRMRDKGTSLRENSYVSKNGSIVDGWDIDARFPAKGFGDDCASFKTDIIILNKKPEIINDEETGRLIVQGGVIQYGPKLDVLNFVIDDPNSANQVDNAWEINDTVSAWGRIRVTTKEEQRPVVESSWGESSPVEPTTRTVRELVLTGGNPVSDEDFAYDLSEVKKLFNQRKAAREEMQSDSSAIKNSPAAPAKKTRGWE